MTVRGLTIATLVVCQSTQSLVIGGVALFLPLIRADLGISYTQAGTLAAASLTYAAMQLPSGYLADRFTPRRLFLIGLLGTNTLALSFALLSDFHLMLVNQALSGAFRALVFAPGLLLIRAEFPATGRATAMGLFVAGGFSSNILLSSTGPLLVGSLGWRALALTDPNPTIRGLQQACRRAVVAGQHQERLIGALLTLAHSEHEIEQGKLVDMRHLSREALLTLRQQVEDRGLHVDARLDPATAWGDPGLVERLVTNLVHNASSRPTSCPLPTDSCCPDDADVGGRWRVGV